MNFKVLITLLALTAVAAVSFGFTSSYAYQYGKKDIEFTMAVAERDIDKGQWVVMSYSGALASDDCETGAVVTITATENTNSVVGVAMMDADTGAMLKIQTYGLCSYAKVDGVDSGGNTTTTMARGLAINPTAKLGYAGAYITTVGAAAVPVGTQIAGYLVDAVTGRASAAAFADTSTSYDVFITCR